MKRTRKRRLISGLLTVGSFVGTIVTGIFVHKNTKKAVAMMGAEGIEPKNGWDEFKHTWKCYIPSYVSGVLTLVCIAGNDYSNQKYITGLITASGMSYGLVEEFEAKAREMLGDDQVDLIKQAIAEDHLYDIQKAKPQPITVYANFDCYQDEVEEGDVLFYDEMFQFGFRSTLSAVRAGIYHLNRNYQISGGQSALDLYTFWGVVHPKIEDMDKYVWWCDFLCGYWDVNWIDVALIKSRRKVHLKDGTVMEEEYYRIHYPIPPIRQEAAEDESLWDIAEENTQEWVLTRLGK